MIPGTLAEIIVDLYKRSAEHDRRFENRERTGTIAEVDAKKGLARVKLGEDKDGKPYLSPWVPWKETAMGAIKTHFPPSVGEQVKLVSESGDLTDAVIDTSLPSDANKRPHDKERETVVDINDGKWRQHVDAGGSQTETHAGNYTRNTGGAYDLDAGSDIHVDSGGITYINCG
jgi:phage baseplate assembly protein V